MIFSRALPSLLLAVLFAASGCPSNDADDTTDDDTGDDDDADDDDNDTTPSDPCDDGHFSDDDLYESACDDDFSDDDTQGCEGDDDTAGGTWYAKYDGYAKVAIAVDGNQASEIECRTIGTMTNHINSFSGVIDCSESPIVSATWHFDGDKQSSSSCIDGSIYGSIDEVTTGHWFWMGTIGTGSVKGSFRFESEEYSVSGLLCLPARPVSVIKVSPYQGDTGGGYPITITGTSLGQVNELTVCFGPELASIHEVKDSGSWGAFAYGHAPSSQSEGPVEVKVRNPDGFDRLPDGFRYLD
jgi:hypothetical protein